MTSFSRYISATAAVSFCLFSGPLAGQDAEEAPPAEPVTVKLDFEDLEPGKVADEVAFVIDGEFSVVATSENKVLRAAQAPLAESGALLGENLLGDVTISAKVHGTRRGRSYPRFGIGTHGMSGYRLRVVPARKVVELAYKEESVTDVPFTWESDKWYSLKLVVKKTGEDDWKIEGKVWLADGEEPESPTISHENTSLRGKGKSSVWATPYSGTPIEFDDVEIVGAPAP